MLTASITIVVAVVVVDVVAYDVSNKENTLYQPTT